MLDGHSVRLRPQGVRSVVSRGAPPPDSAALYEKHKDAMWRAAGKVLREAGRQDETADVVHAAIESVMSSVPEDVDSWEALLVKTAVRRALDVLRSARVRHDGGELPESTAPGRSIDQFIADDVAEAVDGERAGALVWDALGRLDPRDRRIVWERFVHERSGRELADEFGLSEGRISQIAKAGLKTLRIELEDNGVEGW